MVTTLDQYAVVKMLAAGNDLDYTVAANPHLSRKNVERIATDHGHPSTRLLAEALDDLQHQVNTDKNRIPVTTGPTGTDVASHRQHQLVRKYKADRATTPTPTPARTPAMTDTTPQRETVLDMIARATKITDKKISTLAKKVAGLVTDLDHLVAEYDAKAEARADVQRLEQELAAAREKAGLKKTATKTSTGIDSKAVRAWAAANGIDCNPVGRVNADVVAAYQRAQKGDAA